MAQGIGVTTPVGRYVGGDLYEAQTTDMDGKPLVYKTGTKAGQPAQRWYFALAIPKEPGGQHWAYTEWGKIIWAKGHADFPNGQADRQDFAWKIEDGDSVVPNQNQRKNCDREGYPGNWILKLSSGIAIKCYDAKGEKVLEAGAIKPGYFVQVYLDVAGNDDDKRSPGVYLNPRMVALAAFGDEINFGPDPKAAGFGQNVKLPPNASLTPPAQLQAPGNTAQPPMPGRTALVPPGAHSAMGAAPPPPGASDAAPPPPGGPKHVMTVKAQGKPYEAYIKAGWTDALLIQHGMMEDEIPF